MKRMTSSNYNPCVNCIYSSSCSHIKYNAPVCPERARYDRLAAIEDILGDEYDLDELKEMVQAKREGRCVVLPCKVGDTVYLLEKNCVLENKVLQVSFNNSGDWVVFTDCKSLLFCKIGETAFITREAALKAREQE